MQTTFRLPWCSDTFADSRPDKLSIQNMCPSPVMEMPMFNRMKRKRTDSPETISIPGESIAKRAKTAQVDAVTGRCEDRLQSEQAPLSSVETSQPPLIDLSQPLPATLEAQTKCDMTDTLVKVHATSETLRPEQSTLQETIEHQFNLEILLKHRELRLIEQELAKCQIALEQLRRCELIPYPGASAMSVPVSTGTGPALRAPSGLTEPPAPAPWGVTNGPYSRHYARWLLPDGTFDPVSVADLAAANDAFAFGLEGRPTRNSQAGLGKAGKTRSNRDSLGASTQVSPNYPAAALRNKQGPLVIRRLADNQFVKLVCKHCHRSNFSSVQGFLNHCRIAHKTDYKSHEAAAQDCGRPLEDHETELAAQAPPPVGTTTKVNAPKQIPQPVVSGQVHLLNSSQPPRPTWKRQRIAQLQDFNGQTKSSSQTVLTIPGQPPSDNSFHSSPFVPSLRNPYLSAQFAKRGFGGNLQAVVTEARQKIDLSVEDDGEELREDSAKTSPGGISGSSKSRAVQGAPGLDSDRPPSRKGPRQPLQRPRPAPLSSCFQNQQFRSEIPESPQEANLSPHTADSNPGLVSDHDDDPVSEPDEDSHPEISTARPLALTRSCGDAMDMDVEVEDDDEGHGVLIRPRSLLVHGQEDLGDQGSPSRPRSRYGEGAK